MSAENTALREEIEARLAEVEGSEGSCGGHLAMARALGTLLRCQRAQLNERAAGQASAAKAGGVVGALVIGVIEVGRWVLSGKSSG